MPKQGVNIINRDDVVLPMDSGEESFAIELSYADNKAADSDDSTKTSKEDDSSTNDKANEDRDEDSDKDDRADNKSDNTKSTNKAKSKVKRRIDTLTRKWRETERELERLKQEKSAIKKAVKIDDSNLKKPDEADFEDPNDYVDALIDWKLKVAFMEQQADSLTQLEQATTQTAEELEASKQQYITEAFEEARKKYKDFDEVFTDDVPISSAMVDSLLLLDNMADVAYYLGQNVSKAGAIAKMSKMAAAMELQRIALELQNKKASRSPAPIEPVRGTNINKSLENMSYAEYRAEMAKREKARKSL
jgi:hypothetical protein